MVQRAVEELPGFTVSGVEANATETSYTIDTIRTLRATVKGELWFIIGLDAFLDIAGWKSADALLASMNFLVLSRPHVPFSRVTSLTLFPPLPLSQLERLDEGHQQRLDHPIGAHTTITFLRTDPCKISSSAVRERIRKGEDVAGWLPLPVHSYILERKLYVPH